MMTPIILASLLSLTLTSDAVEPLPNPWEIKPEFSYFLYQEPDNMSEDGSMKGLSGSYTAYRNPGFNRMEVRYSSGEVDYDGKLLFDDYGDIPYTINNCKDYIVDIRLLTGSQKASQEQTSQFYIGLGYRYLNDDMSSDPAGYKRESNYLYLPLGLRARLELDQGWYVAWTLEFDLLLHGRQNSYLPQQTIRNKQSRGIGSQGSLELGCHVKGFDFGISPFVRTWLIDASNLDQGYQEPYNTTLEYGMSVVVRF